MRRSLWSNFRHVRAVAMDANGVIYARTGPSRRIAVEQFMKSKFAGDFDMENKAINAAARASSRAAHRQTKLTVDDVQRLKEMASRGEISASELYKQTAHAWGVPDDLLDEAARIMAAADAEISLYEGTIEGLASLRLRGLRVAVITNSVSSSATKLAWLRSRGLDIEWDSFVNSVDVGAKKPDAPIYKKCAATLALPPRQIAFVAHAEDELAGAERIGMLPVHFLPKNEPRSKEKRAGDGFIDSARIPQVSSLVELAERIAAVQGNTGT